MISIAQPKNDLSSFGLGWDETYGPTYRGAWLAEVLRWEASTQFALAVEADSNKCGFSKTLVLNSLTRRLSLWNSDLLSSQLKLCFDALATLKDFGKLDDRKGYIPRESRVVLLAKGWVRMAGGLPERHNECPDDTGIHLLQGTIGRLAKYSGGKEIPDSWEVKRTFLWETDFCKSTVTGIESSLDRVESLADKELHFYHSSKSPWAARWNCWSSSLPREQIVVARSSVASPRSYFLVDRTRPTAGVAMNRDAAMLYLLHLDRVNQRQFPCRLEMSGKELVLNVPNLLPSDWHDALLACSLSYADMGNNFDYTLTHEALPFAESILAKAGSKITRHHV
jgi:hypothetical protein